MKRLFVHISRVCMNALYRWYCSTSERSSQVVFLSRQAEEASYDYMQLAQEFEAAGWTIHMHLKKVKAANMLGYVGHVLRELKLLAQCKLVILDRYDPVVSLIDFDYEPQSPTVHGNMRESMHDQHAVSNELHTEFPSHPVIVQLWHAFGAFKEFGYQTIGTREGHLQQTIDTFNIHRNYTWIMCSSEATRAPYAEAFAYPKERIVAYNRPEFFELLELGQQKEKPQSASKDFTVLLAPTLRKSKASAHPFRSLYEQRKALEAACAQEDISLVWSFHPLEENLPAPGNVSDLLLEADLVVTDYSSIVYEAYLLGKPVLFYLPDLDQYRATPGLTVDPEMTIPDLCTFTPEQLEQCLTAFARTPISHQKAREELAPFAARAFDTQPDESAPQRQTLLETLERAQCQLDT